MASLMTYRSLSLPSNGSIDGFGSGGASENFVLSARWNLFGGPSFRSHDSIIQLGLHAGNLHVVSATKFDG